MAVRLLSCTPDWLYSEKRFRIISYCAYQYRNKVCVWSTWILVMKKIKMVSLIMCLWALLLPRHWNWATHTNVEHLIHTKTFLKSIVNNILQCTLKFVATLNLVQKVPDLRKSSVPEAVPQGEYYVSRISLEPYARLLFYTLVVVCSYPIMFYALHEYTVFCNKMKKESWIK